MAYMAYDYRIKKGGRNKLNRPTGYFHRRFKSEDHAGDTGLGWATTFGGGAYVTTSVSSGF